MTTAEELAEARRAAAHTRAEHLMRVAQGCEDIDEVIEQARYEPALRRISLTQLLAAQPNCSPARAKSIVEHFRRLLARQGDRHHAVPRRLTISHLVDQRIPDERRMEMWRESVWPPPTTPWPGFPHTTRPSR